MTDFFSRVPFRFTRAYRREEIDAFDYLLGFYLVTLAFEGEHTSEGEVVVKVATLAEEFNRSRLIEADEETIRKRLHVLADQDWFERKVKPGARVWTIRLTGLLVVDDDNRRASSEQAENPNLLRRSSREGSAGRRLTSSASSSDESSPDGAGPDGESGSALSEAPLEPPLKENRGPTDETRRNERKPENPNPGLEGNNREDLGPLRVEPDQKFAAALDQESAAPPVAEDVEKPVTWAEIQRVLTDLPEWREAPTAAVVKYVLDLRRLGYFEEEP